MGNDKGRKKDEKINSALTERKQKAEQALMVTDTVGDIKAGVQSIAVSWGYVREKDLAAANPSALVRDSSEFQTQLCHLIKHLELLNQLKSNPLRD